MLATWLESSSIDASSSLPHETLSPRRTLQSNRILVSSVATVLGLGLTPIARMTCLSSLISLICIELVYRCNYFTIASPPLLVEIAQLFRRNTA